MSDALTLDYWRGQCVAVMAELASLRGERDALRIPAELAERVRCAVEDGFDDQDAHSILSDILEVIGELEKSS